MRHVPDVPGVTFDNRPVESKIGALLFGYFRREPLRCPKCINWIARSELQEEKSECRNGKYDGYAL